MTISFASRTASQPCPSNPPAHGVAHSVERGKPISIYFGKTNALDYFFYVPHSIRPDSPIVCAVHGLRRSAAQHVFQLKQFAESHGMVLFAPLFARQQFSYFQKLAPNEDGIFPEDAFDQALNDCLNRLQLVGTKLFMFGFSGGAQFAHRYALIGKQEFQKMALMAPGWFTMPNTDVPYPYGWGGSEALFGRAINTKRALTTPTLVIVGQRDTKRTPSLNQDAFVDEQQGKNRFERCQNWVEAMHNFQASHAIEDLKAVKGGSHNLEKMIHSRGMGAQIFDWFAN